MIVYSKVSAKSLQNAITKAKTEKPLVQAVSLTEYKVINSLGIAYTVKFSKNADGEFVCDCSCQAGKNGNACYHCAAAAPQFKLAVIRRRADTVNPLCVECVLLPAIQNSQVCSRCA